MARDVTWRPVQSPRKKTPRNGRALAILLGLLTVNAGVVLYHGDPTDAADEPQEADVAPVPSPEPEADLEPNGAESVTETSQLAPFNPFAGMRAPGPVHRVETIALGRGQTAAAALVGAGVDGDTVAAAIESLVPHIQFRRLQPGDIFKARFDEDEQLISLDINRGLLERGRTELEADGWRGERIEVAIDTIAAEVSGVVDTTLWDALMDSGEDPRLVHEIVDIFAWDIDFYSEVFVGDTFRLLVDKRFVEGEFLEYGDVKVAEFVSDGQAHRAFIHYGDNHVAAYYDSEGNSMRKQLLKAPLKYAHVTSRYGNRKHPILGYTRKHNGIDYGVPSGTQVWSVGDGRVMRAGWNGGYGRFIEVRHTNGWTSHYAHLSKISVKPGQRVEQKQVIGAVGKTGLATGPHLHYELKRHGAFVNPLTQKFERGKRLAGEELSGFTERAAALSGALEKVRVAGHTPDAAQEG